MSASPQPIQSQAPPQAAPPSPKWAVQAPDGKVIQFPDQFTDADVTREMSKMYPLGQEAQAAAHPPIAPTIPVRQTGLFGEQVAPLNKQQNQAKGAYESANLKPIGETLGSMGGASLFPVVKGAGILKNALPFLGRAAASGLGMGAGALAGGAGPQEAGSALVAGAAAQPAAEGLSAFLSKIAPTIKNAAVSQYERALAPTTKINKSIAQDVAPQLIQRGEVGSLGGLENRATKNIADLNPQLNSAYGQLQGAGKIPGSGTQVISDLENLKQSYMPDGVVAQPQAVNAIQGVQDVVRQYGPDVSPNSLRRLRQIFEEAPAQKGAYAGADLSTSYTLNAQQQAADSIRGILNKAPDIGTLNKEISFWLDVQRVTSQSGLRRTGQEGGLMKVLSPLAGTLAGGAGVLEGGAKVGVGAAVATTLSGYAIQAMRSPLWRTTSAVVKDQLANALARGDVGAVSSLMTRFGVATAQSKGAQGVPTNQGNAPQALPWQ